MVRKVPQAERAQRADELLELVRAGRRRRPPAGAALGRPAPARGAGARADQPAAGAAARRAAGRARPEAARADAERAQGAAAAAGHHLPLHHPRPARGAVDERPHRRLQPRPARTGGHAAARSTTRRRRASSRSSSARPTCSTATPRAASPAMPARCCGPSASGSAPTPRRARQRHGARGAVLRRLHARARCDAAGAALQADLPDGRAASALPGAGRARAPALGRRARCTRLRRDAAAVNAGAGATRSAAPALPPRCPTCSTRAAGCCCWRCWRRRCCGSASSTSARCSRCCANAFFGLDDFTGQVVREFTLQNFVDLLDPANLDVARRIGDDGGRRDAGLHRARLSRSPTTWRATPRGAQKALLYIAVMLPLWSSYLVRALRLEAAAGQGGRDLLAGGAAARGLAARRACSPCR